MQGINLHFTSVPVHSALCICESCAGWLNKEATGQNIIKQDTSTSFHKLSTDTCRENKPHPTLDTLGVFWRVISSLLSFFLLHCTCAQASKLLCFQHCLPAMVCCDDCRFGHGNSQLTFGCNWINPTPKPPMFLRLLGHLST